MTQPTTRRTLRAALSAHPRHIPAVPATLPGRVYRGMLRAFYSPAILVGSPLAACVALALILSGSLPR